MTETHYEKRGGEKSGAPDEQGKKRERKREVRQGVKNQIVFYRTYRRSPQMPLGGGDGENCHSHRAESFGRRTAETAIAKQIAVIEHCLVILLFRNRRILFRKQANFSG